ncbi:E3 binding domain-containing protein, partial [Acinetobacter baumannii]
MPSAAKLMAENNLSAGQVAGTGRDGRITKGDVLGAVAGGAKPAAATAAAPQAARPALQQVAAPVDF